jgi:ribonuclease T2
MRRALSFAGSAVVIVSMLTGFSPAASRKKKSTSTADFSYYMLVLSYAPDFCAQPGGSKDARECGTGRHVGFVVHGLWPQGDSTRGPENCGSARPVAQDIVQTMLRYIPTESLIQHEWASHGTCSGMSAADYFAAVRKARDSVTVPAQLSQPAQQMQLAPADAESQFAAANPGFPKEAFRTSCYRDGELQEVRICLNKDLSPRPCTVSAGECSVGKVTMLPVR